MRIKIDDPPLEDWSFSIKTLSSNYKSLLRTLRLTWTVSSWRILGPICTLIILRGVLPATSLFLTRHVLDEITGGQKDLIAIAPGIAALALTIVVMQGIAPVLQAYQSLLADRLRNHIILLTMEKSHRLPDLARFEDARFHDQIQMIRQANTKASDLLLNCIEASQNLLQLVFYSVLLGSLHPLLPAVFILFLIPYSYTSYLFKHRAGLAIQFQTPEARKLEYYRNQFMSAASAKDFRLFTLSAYFLTCYQNTFERIRQVIWKVRWQEFRWLFSWALLGTVSLTGIYVFLLANAIDTTITLGSFIVIGMAAFQIWMCLENLIFSLGLLNRTGGFLVHLYDFLDAKPDIAIIPEERHRQVPSPFHHIVFQDVSFQYPGSGRKVLDRVSFSMTNGESLALIGKNGAGKTTVVKLLTRMYDPTEGEILIDDIPLRHFNVNDLRQQMSAVFQNFLMLQLTVRENIGIGDLSQMECIDSIKTAGCKAGAGFIGALPQNYETQLGKQFEGGTDISMGQWQKLALARLYLKNNAQIFILDEPTSALDIQSEFDIYQQFHQLTMTKATLVISHRLSMARLVDEIVVLDDGRIIETGSHDELVGQDGLYTRLYNKQADKYRELQ